MCTCMYMYLKVICMDTCEVPCVLHTHTIRLYIHCKHIYLRVPILVLQSYIYLFGYLYFYMDMIVFAHVYFFPHIYLFVGRGVWGLSVYDIIYLKENLSYICMYFMILYRDDSVELLLHKNVSIFKSYTGLS